MLHFTFSNKASTLREKIIASDIYCSGNIGSAVASDSYHFVIASGCYRSEEKYNRDNV